MSDDLDELAERVGAETGPDATERLVRCPRMLNIRVYDPGANAWAENSRCNVVLTNRSGGPRCRRCQRTMRRCDCEHDNGTGMCGAYCPRFTGRAGC